VKSARNSRLEPDVSAAPVGQSAQWVVFCLETGRYALPLSAVDRVVRAAWVTPLPLAPDVVLGAIDVEGQVLPVFNLRRRFQLPERAIGPADHFLIARTTRGAVVLVIDSAQGLLDCPATPLIDAQSVGPNRHISGVIQLEDGLVLIQDLEHFLSPDEARTLDEAMNAQVSNAG
jgi:purine-binding chemotaxis protein CheW